MKVRIPKENDIEIAEVAYELILNLMQAHPEIEPNIWAAGMWSILANGYANSGVSYELFCKECDEVKEFYKHLWDDI